MNETEKPLSACESPAQPTAEQITEHVSGILASRALSRAPSLGRFLEYIVRYTLEERTDRLKEYEIGVAVFERGGDFDPRLDTIVRVQARKLRKRLEDFYESEDRPDSTIRIVLPKGSYVPIFETKTRPTKGNGALPTLDRNRRPHVAIAASCAMALLAGMVLGYGLATRFSRTPAGIEVTLTELEVVHHLPGAASIATQLRSILGIEIKTAGLVPVTSPSRTGLALTGALELRGSRVRINFRLYSTNHDVFLWSGTYEGQATQQEFIEHVGRAVAKGAKEGIDGFECVHIY